MVALLACLSCSDDETSVRGTLVIDDVSYDLHTVYGQAEVASDYSYYSYIIMNSKGKINGDEEVTGKGINGIMFEFYRETSSNQPITGTFYNDDSEEHYDIDDISAVIGYNSETDNGIFLDSFEYAEVIISKSGSKFKFIFEGVTEEGIEVTMTFTGPLKKLDDRDSAPTRKR